MATALIKFVRSNENNNEIATQAFPNVGIKEANILQFELEMQLLRELPNLHFINAFYNQDNTILFYYLETKECVMQDLVKCLQLHYDTYGVEGTFEILNFLYGDYSKDQFVEAQALVKIGSIQSVINFKFFELPHQIVKMYVSQWIAENNLVLQDIKVLVYHNAVCSQIS